MANNASGLTADQVNAADTLRTQRAFVGFLGSVLGVDQTFAGEDSDVSNAPGQFVIANPDGSYSVIGKSFSNVQGQSQTMTYPGQTTAQVAKGSGLVITPTLLMLGLAAFFLFKKMR